MKDCAFEACCLRLVRFVFSSSPFHVPTLFLELLAVACTVVSELQLEPFYDKGIYGMDVLDGNVDFIGDGERICVLDSGFTMSSLFQSKYDVETHKFSDLSPHTDDVLNHGTASVSVRELWVKNHIHFIDSRKSEQAMSGSHPECACFCSESGR